MNKRTRKFLLPAILATSVMSMSTATAGGGMHEGMRDGERDDSLQNQYEPITLLINFQVASSGMSADSNGTSYYIVGGPGYAPEKIFPNGEISDEIEPERQVAVLEGAQITMQGEPTDAVINFTCLAGSCKMKLKDGGVLVSNAGVQLEGRAINMWGPVYKAPTYNSTDGMTGILPIRILGCGGLKEIAGKGRVANMVGSVCFNGIFNFNTNDPMDLTGASKCTITMHTPAPGVTIP